MDGFCTKFAFANEIPPTYFIQLYINDLDDDITSKFADEQVCRKIKSDADRQPLQDDLNKLIEWSEEW